MQNHPNEHETRQPTDNEKMLEAVRRFYGPPTNCSALSELGYTLNCFYLVKAPENKNDGQMQVEVVSCAFKHPEGIYNRSNIIEKKASINYLYSIYTIIHTYY